MLSRSILGITAVLAMNGGARAQAPSEDLSLAALSAPAELVFQGTVEDIAYASSVEGIPHTFVTYRVEDVLKGASEEPTLVLRFIGGEKVERAGVIRRLSVSHMPRFSPGQQDLLMVRGNGRAECPLVRCAQGRFRFVDGFVTTEEGLLLGQDARSDVRLLPPARQSPLAPDIADRPYDPRGFVAHLRDVIGRQPKAAVASSVRSADPLSPFRGPVAVAAPPPREPVTKRSAQIEGGLSPQALRDREEEEALRRNGGNPVLPESLP